LAQIYDRIFGGYRAKVWEQARQRWLGKVLPRVRSICDLGCGTGEAALAHARRGYKVLAVDLSPDMCRTVREKARRAGLPVRVLQADMRSFRLREPVDLITAEYAVLNHARNDGDLRRVMRAVARALRPGGYFYSDITHRQGLKQVWTGTQWFDLPELFLAKSGGYDSKRGRGWIELVWFTYHRGAWNRCQDRIEAVAWSKAAVVRALRAAGFAGIETHDPATLIRVAPLNRRGSKTFFLAQMPL
jgi:SAM-dependent methyltransferase